MRVRFLLAALLLPLVTNPKASALVVPFTEDFSAGNSAWSTGNSLVAAGWSANGGVSDGSYITSTGTVLTTGFGAIVFRGNAASDASGDAFVGNWLTGGVETFSAYVRHDAPTPLNFYARLDAGAGRAGSSVDFSVPSGTWFQLNIPIVDAPTSFQSYGAGTFATVFNSIQNVQIALSTNQAPAVVGQTCNLALDKVSVVPEPGSLSLLVLGAVAATVSGWGRRKLSSAKP